MTTQSGNLSAGQDGGTISVAVLPARPAIPAVIVQPKCREKPWKKITVLLVGRVEHICV